MLWTVLVKLCHSRSGPVSLRQCIHKHWRRRTHIRVYTCIYKNQWHLFFWTRCIYTCVYTPVRRYAFAYIVRLHRTSTHYIFELNSQITIFLVTVAFSHLTYLELSLTLLIFQRTIHHLLQMIKVFSYQ